jgi:hypothetical protein
MATATVFCPICGNDTVSWESGLQPEAGLDPRSSLWIHVWAGTAVKTLGPALPPVMEALLASSHYGETTLSSLARNFGLALWALEKGMVLLAGPFFHDHGVAIGVGAGNANRLVP